MRYGNEDLRRSSGRQQGTWYSRSARPVHSQRAHIDGDPKEQIDAHVFYVLEAVAEVANKWMIHMFEHAAFSDDVSYAFGPNDYDDARQIGQSKMYECVQTAWMMRTFIFADVFEGEGETRVFSLDDSDLSESTSANDAK